MDALECKKYALHEVEKLSGKPVIIHRDPTLTFKAKIRFAQENQPAHVLSYQPKMADQLPYLVCYQCGYIRRFFLCPEKDRLNVGANAKTFAFVEELVRDRWKTTKQDAPLNSLVTYSRMITDGLGAQLRSVPIGLRVELLINEQFEALCSMQRTTIMEQLQDNLECLHPKYRESVPSQIFEANAGMNAAFACFWADLWGEEVHAVPYKVAGYGPIADKLMELFRSIPKQPQHDRALVLAWAEKLGIAGLYVI